MNIDYSRIKLILDDQIEGKTVHCIKFIKLRSYEEIFTEDYEKVMLWFETLKRYCVLSRFREYFVSLKVLGKGNFAKVFLVERKTDKKQYAVKIFDKNLILSDELERKCLLYEQKMMRRVEYDQILRLREIYEGENYIYCLCDLCNGGHLLNKMLKTGHFVEAKAVRLQSQLQTALSYLADANIIHRDIKPENMIFRTDAEDSDIVLVDLGFATYCKDYNKLFTRCGTPGYVAPEVLHDKVYDCKADIFSMGTIFYIMLTGKVPFSSKTYEGLVKANMQCQIDFSFIDDKKYKISNQAMNQLQSMLNPNPDRRPTAKECLAHELFTKVHSPTLPPKMDKDSNDRLRNFAENNNFNLKAFPEGKKTDMPDDITDLNSPVASPLIKRVSKDDKDFKISPMDM